MVWTFQTAHDIKFADFQVNYLPRMVSSNVIIKGFAFDRPRIPIRYLDRVAPWLHYVPIQVDFSDLHDALVFFRGDANGEGAHDDLARKIAEAGRQWSQTFWRREDLAAYFFRYAC